MEMNFFLLFLACIVLGSLSIYANLITGWRGVFSYVTLWSFYASIVGAVVLLAVAFYRLFAG